MIELTKNQRNAHSCVTIKIIKLLVVFIVLINIVACGDKKKDIKIIHDEPEIVINTDGDIPADTNEEVADNTIGESNNSSASEKIENTSLKQATLTSNPDIPTPNALDLIPQNIKTFEQETTLVSMFMEDQFYPIGWSADGEKFAYAIVHKTDAAALFSITVTIQDLVTDKLIWKTSKEAENSNFVTYWNNNYTKITVELDKNKVIFGKNITLKQAPISYRQDVFGYTINRKESKNSEKLVGYQLLLLSDKKGTKVISKASFSYKQDQLSGLKLKVQIPGHFQSPKEGRIAVLVGILESGWEGLRVVRYKVIGASLKAGKWK